MDLGNRLGHGGEQKPAADPGYGTPLPASVCRGPIATAPESEAVGPAPAGEVAAALRLKALGRSGRAGVGRPGGWSAVRLCRNGVRPVAAPGPGPDRSRGIRGL